MTGILLDAGPGSVLTHGDRIAAVGPDARAAPHARRLACDGTGEIEIAAGGVDAHTHLYSGLAALGMPAPVPPPRCFLEILERVWWRLDRALDETSLAAAARLAVAEALLAGTTTLVDHHESPAMIDGSLDVVADAASALGARLVTCYGVTERNRGRAEAGAGLRECERFVREARGPAVRGLVGLHASFTVSDETLREAGALARALDVPVHVHVAEDGADVEDAHRRGHAGPLERLLALEALPRGSILAHGVCLDAAQVDRAGAAGLWIVQNPRSNEGNRVGMPRALAHSERVGLGTDGWPADMREEARALERLSGEGPAACAARVRGSHLLAAERFGVGLGPGVEVGAAADLVARVAGAVRHVLVAGRPVVEDGRLCLGDIAEIRTRAREQAARLWKRMEGV